MLPTFVYCISFFHLLKLIKHQQCCNVYNKQAIYDRVDRFDRKYGILSCNCITTFLQKVLRTLLKAMLFPRPVSIKSKLVQEMLTILSTNVQNGRKSPLNIRKLKKTKFQSHPVNFFLKNLFLNGKKTTSQTKGFSKYDLFH